MDGNYDKYIEIDLKVLFKNIILPVIVLCFALDISLIKSLILWSVSVWCFEVVFMPLTANYFIIVNPNKYFRGSLFGKVLFLLFNTCIFILSSAMLIFSILGMYNGSFPGIFLYLFLFPGMTIVTAILIMVGEKLFTNTPFLSGELIYSQEDTY